MVDEKGYDFDTYDWLWTKNEIPSGCKFSWLVAAAVWLCCLVVLWKCQILNNFTNIASLNKINRLSLPIPVNSYP
jgi:hypothetical protein